MLLTFMIFLAEFKSEETSVTLTVKEGAIVDPKSGLDSTCHVLKVWNIRGFTINCQTVNKKLLYIFLTFRWLLDQTIIMLF